MKRLVFATANQNKVREINQMLEGAGFEVVTMAEIGCHDDIPETQPTISGNAIQKAEYLYERYKVDCFAEDSGLEVDALGGAPGVYSARYAGEHKSTTDNNNLLLKNLEGGSVRTARFRTVIALILGGKIHLFEGVCEGIIGHKGVGTGGFGYDPLFTPDVYAMSFAQLGSVVKNEISHRGKAFRGMQKYLRGSGETV
jgi:XTP/dITP diphosphohydrolase